MKMDMIQLIQIKPLNSQTINISVQQKEKQQSFLQVWWEAEMYTYASAYRFVSAHY